MYKKRLLAIVLAASMVFCTPIMAFASTGGASDQVANQTNGETLLDQNSEQPEGNSDGQGDATIEGDSVTPEQDGLGGEPSDNNVVPSDDSAKPLANAAPEAKVDASVWTSEDFTYGPYEKLLYGCDYSRQFTIKGPAITGFSEKGLAKLESNTDLVIPATNDKGEKIVAIANGAFKKKGLTSVKFPTGMMVDYDDTITHRVTKRGNFIIGDYAFENNNLKEVNLPAGVIACLPNSFQNNNITKVTLPKTIWWIENLAFAKNKITTVNFPTTCDFQLEMHGLAFANNFIESVRLPDFTEVVNKTVFAFNKGVKPLADSAPENMKTYENHGATYNAGIVNMYTDNAELEIKDRIHHTGKKTASQQSHCQSLVVNDGTPETQNPSLPWNINDFEVEGTVVKGLSEAGKAKLATNKDLVIPDMTRDGQYITEIASATTNQENGLFATKEEGFDTVSLPNELVKIGDRAFRGSQLKDVVFPSSLKEIGLQAFAMNQLTSVILPDTVTTLGGGAFATNPKLERISLSKGLTEIAGGAFGCSDAKNYMPNLTEIEIPEGITKIGDNAFAGNNFKEIVIPASVKSIGRFAFSTKEYLTDPCTLVLNEGLETIGSDAFRNKSIAEVTLPSTVTKLDRYTFRKQYSSGEGGGVTKVYVSTKAQYDNLYASTSKGYHMLYLKDSNVWTAEDFTYGEQEFALYPADEYSSVKNFKVWTVTGLSDTGKEKIKENKNLVIPAKDPNGKKVQGVADSAFYSKTGNVLDIETLTLPKDVKVTHNKEMWQVGKDVDVRGDFFIGASAFMGNKLSTLDLPEGVIYIGVNAFKNNKTLSNVKLPSTLMFVGNAGFAQCSIETLDFPAKTDFPLNLDSMAFAINKIKSVQLPINVEKVTSKVGKLHKDVFLQNTGMEPVTEGTSVEKKGGIVYMYITDTSQMGNFVDHIDKGTSHVQKLIVGTMPQEHSAWNVADFTFDEAGTTVTGLSEVGQKKIKNNANLIIPEVGPKGEAVVALGNGAAMNGIFMYSEGGKNYAPTSVILPSTLKSIGNFAFASNPKLTYEKDEMTSIVLPEGLESIGMSAFQQSALTSVSIPDSVTSLGTGAFVGSALTSVKLPSGLKEIPASAFSGQDNRKMEIENLVIPEGVEVLGRGAFQGAHVHNVSFPSTLREIGNNAFENHQMKSVVIPDKVTSIGNYAFRIRQEGWKRTLESVTLNDGLLKIGKEAFGQSRLTELELPSSVTTLDDLAFKDGYNGIVKLYTSNKEQVEKFNTDKANQQSHKVIFDKLVGTGWNAADFTYDEATGTITGWSEEGNLKRLSNKNLVLPDKTPGGKDIVAVGDHAFEIPLSEVVVTKFGYDSPNGMKTVSLPKNVTKIGNSAFMYNALTKVDLYATENPAGITAIGSEAFKGNDLVAADVPATVIELGDGAFSANDITEIKLPDGMKKIPAGIFSMNIRLDHITLPSTVEEIGDTAFAGARLTELTIPATVKKIGRKSFHLHHLTSLTIPASVEELGESAFEGTYKATTLKNLTIEDGDKPLTIAKYAFKEGLLSSVVLPKRLTGLGEQIFLNNSGYNDSKVVNVDTANPYVIGFYNDLVAAGKSDKDITFKVNDLRTEITDKNVTLSEKSFVFNGKEQKPEIIVKDGDKVLVEGQDYEVVYPDDDYTNPGTKNITINGINDYRGSVALTYSIVTDEPTNPGGGDTEDKPGSGNTPGGNGSGSGSGTAVDGENASVETGDNTIETLSLLGMLFAFASAAFVFVARKRKNN